MATGNRRLPGVAVATERAVTAEREMMTGQHSITGPGSTTQRGTTGQHGMTGQRSAETGWSGEPAGIRPSRRSTSHSVRSGGAPAADGWFGCCAASCGWSCS